MSLKLRLLNLSLSTQLYIIYSTKEDLINLAMPNDQLMCSNFKMIIYMNFNNCYMRK
nr:hypothetical protein Itr_chr04CG16420 [Ipomoea trifida]